MSLPGADGLGSSLSSQGTRKSGLLHPLELLFLYLKNRIL